MKKQLQLQKIYKGIVHPTTRTEIKTGGGSSTERRSGELPGGGKARGGPQVGGQDKRGQGDGVVAKAREVQVNQVFKMKAAKNSFEDQNIECTTRRKAHGIDEGQPGGAEPDGGGVADVKRGGGGIGKLGSIFSKWEPDKRSSKKSREKLESRGRGWEYLKMRSINLQSGNILIKNIGTKNINYSLLNGESEQTSSPKYRSTTFVNEVIKKLTAGERPCNCRDDSSAIYLAEHGGPGEDGCVKCDWGRNEQPIN